MDGNLAWEALTFLFFILQWDTPCNQVPSSTTLFGDDLSYFVMTVGALERCLQEDTEHQYFTSYRIWYKTVESSRTADKKSFTPIYMSRTMVPWATSDPIYERLKIQAHFFLVLVVKQKNKRLEVDGGGFDSHHNKLQFSRWKAIEKEKQRGFNVGGFVTSHWALISNINIYFLHKTYKPSHLQDIDFQVTTHRTLRAVIPNMLQNAEGTNILRKTPPSLR